MMIQKLPNPVYVIIADVAKLSCKTLLAFHKSLRLGASCARSLEGGKLFFKTLNLLKSSSFLRSYHKLFLILNGFLLFQSCESAFQRVLQVHYLYFKIINYNLVSIFHMNNRIFKTVRKYYTIKSDSVELTIFYFNRFYILALKM